MHSELFSPQHAEVGGAGIQKQGGKMAKVAMGGGEVLARAGSMVAYQGDLRFEALGSGGLGKFLKPAAHRRGCAADEGDRARRPVPGSTRPPTCT